MKKYMLILPCVSLVVFCGTHLAAMQQPEEPAQPETDYVQSAAQSDISYESFSPQVTYYDLFLAAQRGDLETIQQAHNAHLDLNTVSPQTKLTPLGTACRALFESTNYEQVIHQFSEVIIYLARRTPPPTTDEEWNIRATLYTIVGDSATHNVAICLQQSFLPFDQRTYAMIDQSDHCCCGCF